MSKHSPHPATPHSPLCVLCDLCGQESPLLTHFPLSPQPSAFRPQPFPKPPPSSQECPAHRCRPQAQCRHTRREPARNTHSNQHRGPRGEPGVEIPSHLRQFPTGLPTSHRRRNCHRQSAPSRRPSDTGSSPDVPL